MQLISKYVRKPIISQAVYGSTPAMSPIVIKIMFNPVINK